MKECNPRLIAGTVIAAVTQGLSLTDALNRYSKNGMEKRDRAFIQALCYGTCRYYIRLDILLSYLLRKPFAEEDADIHALLLVGLFQLVEMREAEHAYVSETVNAAKALNKPWAAKLVNAILRQYLRHKDALIAKLDKDLEAKYNHPKWWMTKIKKAWPNHWQSILKANDEPPPLALRVNTQKIDRAAYLTLLEEKNMHAEVIPETLAGIRLKEPVPVQELPQFGEGFVSVQDGAAQLAAPLLQVEPGQQILDACAAPGGKLMHLLELEPKAHYTAVEKDAKRAEKITENLNRSGQKARIIIADAAKPSDWNASLQYDRILIDAPCSASGVIRRHPDIKLLRQPEDLFNLVSQQQALLTASWPLLLSGGFLLYATCSIFPEENHKLITNFLANTEDAKEVKIHLPVGEAAIHGVQILPGMHDLDGFYYALLQKC